MFFLRPRRLLSLLTEQSRALHHHIHFSEARIMTAIQDATNRIVASAAANTTALASLVAAASLEIQQVADALTNGGETDLDALAAQLNAASDSLDAGVATATASVTALGADDPAAPAAPVAPVDPTAPANQ